MTQEAPRTAPPPPEAGQNAPDVLAPAKLGPVTPRDRVIKAATYEGLSRMSLVTDELIGFHVRHAQGGVGMTTAAYCAVAPEGVRTGVRSSGSPRRCRPSGRASGAPGDDRRSQEGDADERLADWGPGLPLDRPGRPRVKESGHGPA